MATVKEKDLPQVTSLADADFIRTVSSVGDSEIIRYQTIRQRIASDVLEDMPAYVTYKGSSGAWSYRRWSDGTVEAWTKASLGAQTGTIWATPIRYKDLTAAIPSGIFTEAPAVFVTSTSSQWWVNSADATSATSVSFRLLTLAASEQSASVAIYAKGY